MQNVISLSHFKNKECTLMDKLKRARESSGVSVNEIAKKLGMAPAAYRRYERGEVYPKINICRDICKIIGKTIGEVFDEDHEAPAQVDLSYRARPGQTLYIKVEVDENGGLVMPEKESLKIINGD